MMTGSHKLDDALAHAASLIRAADAILITAGAGIGIDSGLPDFRGEHGFWRAYPGLGRLGMRFVDIANPQAFRTQPDVAWGFYGHRLRLYRQTVPHDGFRDLLRIANRTQHGAFVFTSNVDGQFQKAGFDEARIVECHGSIHHLQCSANCGCPLWPATLFEPNVDDTQCRLLSDKPVCPQCGALARPNILMFGDWDWDDSRMQTQMGRLRDWIRQATRPVVMEFGAGTAVATVRHFGENLGWPLLRINPDEPAVGRHGDVSLPLGAKDAAAALAGAVCNN